MTDTIPTWHMADAGPDADPSEKWRAGIAARWMDILKENAAERGSAVHEDAEAIRCALREIERLTAERDAALKQQEVISRSLANNEATEHKLRRFLRISRDEGTQALERAERAEKALLEITKLAAIPPLAPEAHRRGIWEIASAALATTEQSDDR